MLSTSQQSPSYTIMNKYLLCISSIIIAVGNDISVKTGTTIG